MEWVNESKDDVAAMNKYKEANNSILQGSQLFFDFYCCNTMALFKKVCQF